MADRPILFSGPMVRALLAGTKTQTRRAMKPQPELLETGRYHVFSRGGGLVGLEEAEVGAAAVDYLRIAVGDRLYVREHWRTWEMIDHKAPRDMVEGERIWPVATYPEKLPAVGKFRQGMHMPRWASRITLTVTDVRVERLQDISRADALAEGMFVGEDGFYRGADGLLGQPAPQSGYFELWDHINGERAYEANPWVAAYSFTVEHGNIDALAKAS